VEIRVCRATDVVVQVTSEGLVPFVEFFLPGQSSGERVNFSTGGTNQAVFTALPSKFGAVAHRVNVGTTETPGTGASRNFILRVFVE
jgi:hypothetical protein